MVCLLAPDSRTGVVLAKTSNSTAEQRILYQKPSIYLEHPLRCFHMPVVDNYFFACIFMLGQLSTEKC